MKARGCQLGLGFEGFYILIAACIMYLFKVSVNPMEFELYILCTRRFFYLGELVL